MKNWVDKYLFPERGIYFAGAANFNRIRKVMLKTWLPQRMLCTGYNKLDLLPPLEVCRLPVPALRRDQVQL